MNWLKQRAAGVLLHPTSLPSRQGVGCLGESARQFVDFLQGAGMCYWQLCPLGPTGFGDSPYQCFSAFAGNPYLIDLTQLIELGLLSKEECEGLGNLSHERVDYGGLYERFFVVLQLAFSRYNKCRCRIFENFKTFEDFKKSESSWLNPYAYFQALKNHFLGKPWFEWPEGLRSYDLGKNHPLIHSLAVPIEAIQFYQYLFFAQWDFLKKYASQHGIKIIGDIPIFVGLDSADVWAHPEIFQLNKEGLPLAVAGVPPDYFSPTGQFWGNPLFNWDLLKKQRYDWWMRRLGNSFKMYDVVRIDHFRAFHNYWEIPANANDARKGSWKRGPGLDFFLALKEQFPNAQLIAEDLGDLVPEVLELRDTVGLPGMAILQFAFGGDADNPYLPHNLKQNSVIYTGSHDNDSSWGWYQSAPEKVRDHFRRYLRVPGNEVPWDLIRSAYESISNLAIIPMQDLLSLGSESRMNSPGCPQGNWQWRFSQHQLNTVDSNASSYLKNLAQIYGRV